MANKKFYEIRAQAGEEAAQIWIYEQIGEDWWSGEGVTAKNFVKEIGALKASQIDLHINSPGGSVFDGQAIYNALKRHPAKVTAYVDGVAASIASVIALAGDEVVMAENALFMIHNPWGFAQGDSVELRKYADLLDKVRDTILSVYREKTGMEDEALTAAMDGETWYSAEEALAAGFIDKVGHPMKMAASAQQYDLKALGFRRPPVSHVTAGMPQQEEVSSKTTEAAQAAETITAPQAEPKEARMSVEASVAPAAGARNIQQEAAEITAMCVQNRCAEKAADFIREGLTPDQAGRQILDMHAAGKLSTPAQEAAAIVDMGKDAKNYSYTRAIAAAIDMREGRAASGLEVEIHQEISKKLPQNYASKGGILVPMRVGNNATFAPRSAVLTTGGSTTGAETVFQEYGEFIDLLRNMACCTALGARTLTDLRGPINFPKQTGAMTAQWMAENSGSGANQSNITFGTVSMSPKTLQGTGALSRQLLVQSTPDVEGLVREDLAIVHALAWDLAAMHGTGQNNQPTGIYNASGVNAVAMGGVPAFGKLVDMETEINKDNALRGSLAWCTTPGMAGKMRQTLENNVAGANWIWRGNVIDGEMAGYRAMSSNQCSSSLGAGTNEHCMILGNWADLLIGMWAGLELIVDPYTLADQGLVKITSFQMVDIALRRTESFCKATGATLS